MENPRITGVIEAYACLSRGDLDGLFAGFTDETRLIEASCLPYGGEFVGREAAKAVLMRIGSVWKNVSFDLIEVVGGDKIVVAHGVFSATARATGKSVRLPLAEVWEFAGDLLKSLTPLYFDTAAVVAALED